MSQFNFIYAEEHLSHREKAVYIYPVSYTHLTLPTNSLV